MMDLYQRSPIVRAFIEANGMRDPGDAIVDCAIDLLEEVGIDKPPVNLHIVAPTGCATSFTSSVKLHECLLHYSCVSIGKKMQATLMTIDKSERLIIK